MTNAYVKWKKAVAQPALDALPIMPGTIVANAKPILVRKHLPGKHDQKTHTPKGYGLAPSSGYMPGTGDYAFGETKVNARGVELSHYEQEPALEKLLEDEFPTGLTWQDAMYDTNDSVVLGQPMSSVVKETVVENLAAKTGIDKSTANALIRQWAETSNDNNMNSLSLQEAASEEFGLLLSDWQQKLVSDKRQQFAEYEQFYSYADNFAKEHGYAKFEYVPMNYSTKMELREGWPPGVANPDIKSFDYMMSYAKREFGLTSRENERKFLRAIYDDTQTSLAKQGLKPSDMVTLYRGVALYNKHDWEVGQVNKWKGNAIESWSLSRDVAGNFARERGEGMGLTMAIRVPAMNIFSSARTGMGCLTEGEFIIFGNIPGQTAKVVDLIDFEAAYRD